MIINDGSMPLPESDLTVGMSFEDEVQQEVAEELASEMQPEPGPKKASRQWSHSDDFTVATLTVKEGELTGSADYAIPELPAVSQAYLAYVGLTVFLSRSDDINAHYGKLRNGTGLGVRGNGKTAAPKRDYWREAIAAALVDARKKSSAPLTQETALERARSYSKEEVKGLKLDATVVRHFNKLSGGTIGFSIAGMLSKEEEASD